MDSSTRSSGPMSSSALSAALSDLPSASPVHFSRLRRLRGSAMHPPTYITLHNTDPPASQVITTDRTNLLLRFISKQSEEKRKSHKRSLGDESFDAGIDMSMAHDGNAAEEDDDAARGLEPTVLVYPPHPKRQKLSESENN